MIDIQTPITDVSILANRYIFRNGMPFTAIGYPGNVYDAVVVKYPKNIPISMRSYGSSLSLEEQIAFINQYKLEKILIVAESIDFIKQCPSLKYIRIVPADSSSNGFDYSPLYEMPQIKGLQCQTVYGSKNEFSTSIDCGRISGLESISVTNNGYKNYNTVKTLRSLGLSHYGERDLSGAFCSKVLDTLSLIQCKTVALDGIENSNKMQCLYLYHNRSLQDIRALEKVKNSLRALRIENCPKISDFSVLGKLENLELLQLSGKNELPDLSFLKTMKKLKTFTFNMNVADGDLSPCLRLSYVYSEKNRKHYNIKDGELPKGQYIRGNESIDPWRRME